MSESQQKVLQIEEIEKYWDEFSTVYSDRVTGALSSFYISMLHFLKIEESKNIFEAAVGPGYMIPHLIQRKQNDAKITVTDLSPKILGICQKRLELFLENPFQNLYNFDAASQEPFNEKIEIKQLGTTIQKANSEDLVDFKDNSFDTYISCLCLQITTDPVKMIQEAYRVLQPGGKAAMNVWGRQSHSQMMILLQGVIHDMGIKIPQPARNNFHLNDKEKLIKMFEKEGFFVQLAWEQFAPVNIISSKDDVDNLFEVSFYKRVLNQVPEEQQQAFKDECHKRMGQIIVDQKQSIGLESIIILVQKPEQK